jgi:4-amino-4-deoxy-L-arabinose transferase-like glycosyltransferase
LTTETNAVPVAASAAPEAEPEHLRFGAFRLSPAEAFAGFTLLHMAVWTVLPAVFDHAGPVDMLEGLYWGREWQLGYYKHPPLQAWLLEAVAWLSGRQLWACYLLSQCAIAVTFWAVWRLARLVVSQFGALIAVLLLEGVFYFTRHSPEFNPNVAQLPFWALAAWSFYRATRFGGTRDWALLGLWLALAAYAKYSSALLALTMVGFLLLDRQARKAWHTAGPYLCGAICLALLVPHLWWVAEHGFSTIAYVAGETMAAATTWQRLAFPLRFAGAQLGQLLAALLLAALLLPGETAKRTIHLVAGADAFDRRFVATLSWGPFLLAFVPSMVGGLRYHISWGYPLWCFIGLFAVLFVVPSTGAAAMRRFQVGWSAVFVGVPVLCAAGLAAAPYLRAAGVPAWCQAGVDSLLYHQVFPQFPAKALAREVTAQWHAKVGGRLPYVIGDIWNAGAIAFHSPDRPSVLTKGNPADSPWIDMADLRRRGAIVVWEAGHDDNHIAEVAQRRFPGLAWQQAIVLPLDTAATLPPLRIMWGILYPSRADVPARPVAR